MAIAVLRAWNSGAPKKFEDKELEEIFDEERSQMLAELGKILQVDDSTV